MQDNEISNVKREIKKQLNLSQESQTPNFTPKLHPQT